MKGFLAACYRGLERGFMRPLTLGDLLLISLTYSLFKWWGV